MPQPTKALRFLNIAHGAIRSEISVLQRRIIENTTLLSHYGQNAVPVGFAGGSFLSDDSMRIALELDNHRLRDLQEMMDDLENLLGALNGNQSLWPDAIAALIASWL